MNLKEDIIRMTAPLSAEQQQEVLAFIQALPHTDTHRNASNSDSWRLYHILHNSVLVNDTQTALAFYHGVLGLPINPHRPTNMKYPGAWLDINAQQQLHLLELPNPDSRTHRPEHGGRDRHTALAVEHFDALLKRLEQAGIPHTTSQSGRAAVFCRDPDGNTLEFIGG